MVNQTLMPRPSVQPCGSAQPLLAVLEADPAILALLEELLADAALRVTTLCLAPTLAAPETVRTFLAQEQPQLVLCDVLFPYAAGRQLLAQVHAQLPGVPLLALSTSPEALDGLAGVAAVVGKPFDVERLLGLVRQMLQREGAGMAGS
jgi:DNA-binding response OmpR family regulator